jgi:F-type H+-transporting ATPase subunit delta
MTLTSVAKRYAEALADVVTAPGSAIRPEEAVKELRSFDEALALSHELRAALATPAAPVARKRAVVGRIADILKLSGAIRNFLYVLVDHRRTSLLPEIADGFELTLDERMGFARAEVTAARELTEAQRASLNKELEKLTGKRIRMRTAVDESLIGGLVAKIGSTVYDGSVRGQLETLERRMGAES